MAFNQGSVEAHRSGMKLDVDMRMDFWRQRQISIFLYDRILGDLLRKGMRVFGTSLISFRATP